MVAIGRWRRATPPRGEGQGPVADPVVERIDAQVQRLYAMVADRLDAATVAFLDGDRGAAGALVASDPAIDSLQLDVEDLVQRELDRRAELTDGELAHLVLVLRIVPELERSADLVEHIALRTGHGLEQRLSPSARGFVADMGRTAGAMWRAAGRAYVEGDAAAAEVLRRDDDELDDLHVRLTAELANATLPPSAAIELGLVARFLERLGDHAVNVTRRLPGATWPSTMVTAAP